MTRPHILVAEDEGGLRDLLVYHLEREGFAVSTVADGESAARRLREEPPDLALLDWMLPRRSGLEICRELRANPARKSLPVIMLTARAEVEDRVDALDSGADDYVTKPFSMAELTSRVRAVLRRAEAGAGRGPLRSGDILLDRRMRCVWRAGRPVHLGPKEFGILECLMQDPGRVFSRAELLEAAWGRHAFVDPRTVDVNVNRLRRALAAAGCGRPDPDGAPRRLCAAPGGRGGGRPAGLRRGFGPPRTGRNGGQLRRDPGGC